MKTKKLSRRRFLGLSPVVGALAFFPESLFKKAGASVLTETPDIAVIHSTDYYRATFKAIEAIGGISKFVRSGNKVGLLINGEFTHEGTFTNPDISFAVLKMCFDAGAGEVMIFRADWKNIWQKSKYYDSHADLLSRTTRSSGNKVIPVERGKALKEAKMINEIFDLDTLINVPIAKNHDAAFLTCCLKNMMGLCDRSTNILFHSIDGKPPTDNDRLAHAIADINTVRLPDLTIVDATKFLITNGPHGPGEVRTENKVLAGTDPVALDAYCAGLHDLDPGMVMSTEYAAEHKLGEADLSKLSVKELELV